MFHFNLMEICFITGKEKINFSMRQTINCKVFRESITKPTTVQPPKTYCEVPGGTGVRIMTPVEGGHNLASRFY